MQDEYKDVPEGVIAADFYHSNELMALSDEAIVQKVHDTLKICEPGFRDAKVGSGNSLTLQAWTCRK